MIATAWRAGGASDALNFDLGAATDDRSVVTDADRENSRLVVHDDSVELTLFVDYELSSPGDANPSFVAGEASGEAGDLIVTAGGAAAARGVPESAAVWLLPAAIVPASAMLRSQSAHRCSSGPGCLA